MSFKHARVLLQQLRLETLISVVPILCCVREKHLGKSIFFILLVTVHAWLEILPMRIVYRGFRRERILNIEWQSLVQYR